MSSSVLTQGIQRRLKKSFVCISDVETILEKWVFQAGDRRISVLLEHYKKKWSWKIIPSPKELADPLTSSLVEGFIEAAPNLNPGLVITASAVVNMNLSESGKVLVSRGVGEEVEARVVAGTIRMILSRYREMKKNTRINIRPLQRKHLRPRKT